MTESLFWWITQFSINFLDFVMMYVITHALINRCIKPNAKHITLAILYTVTIAPIGYFNNYGFRLASILFLLFAIKLIIKRSLDDVITVYVISTIIVFTIQPLMLLPTWLLGFNQSASFLFTQVFTTGAVIFVCNKLKLNQWFHTIQVNTVLKLILFFVTLILLIFLFILNFDYHISYFLFFTISVLLISTVLFPILVQLYHNSIKIVSLLDLKNFLFSRVITMEQMDNIEEIKAMLIILGVMLILNVEYHLSNILFFTITISLIGIGFFSIFMKLYHHSINNVLVHDLNNSLLSGHCH